MHQVWATESQWRFDILIWLNKWHIGLVCKTHLNVFIMSHWHRNVTLHCCMSHPDTHVTQHFIHTQIRLNICLYKRHVNSWPRTVNTLYSPSCFTLVYKEYHIKRARHQDNCIICSFLLSWWRLVTLPDGYVHWFLLKWYKTTLALYDHRSATSCILKDFRSLIRQCTTYIVHLLNEFVSIKQPSRKVIPEQLSWILTFNNSKMVQWFKGYVTMLFQLQRLYRTTFSENIIMMAQWQFLILKMQLIYLQVSSNTRSHRVLQELLVCSIEYWSWTTAAKNDYPSHILKYSS